MNKLTSALFGDSKENDETANADSKEDGGGGSRRPRRERKEEEGT